ncbi:MAG: glutamine amidotransferase-related protein [Alphaproteobacteria bacterium]
MTKTIGVLICMDTDAALSAEHCGQRVRTLLQPPIKAQGHDWQFAFYQAHKGELPDSVADCDAYAVTGSPNSVNDDEPWIEPLFDFIRKIDEYKIPTIGICFGHQAIAKALGGEIVNAGLGWRLGVAETRYRTYKPWMSPEHETLAIPAAHLDQVIALPERAEVLGGNDYCPITTVCVEDHFFTTAYHPEMSIDFLADLVLFLDKKESAKLGDAAYAKALEDVRKVKPQSDEFAAWVVRFYAQKLAA